MPSISLSFYILGLVVASVTANENSTGFTTNSTEFDSDGNYSTTVTLLNTNANVTRTTDTITVTSTSTLNITGGNSTIPPSTTRQKGPGEEPKSTVPSITTPTPSKSKTSTTTTKDKSTIAEPKPAAKTGDITGIIILVVIIVIALVCGAACFFARKRGRRYSVDFTSRPDEANIPLSTMEPELPIDTVSQNAEADKSVVDASAESAAPDKPKEDVVEQSPPAPVEPSVEEKTDDEGVVSNKTSAESLKETNENNSNNADFSQKRDLKRSNIFWDVPLDCPV
ncbi:protein let-653 isoform X3 [Sander lucioperca]|uniref:protein let-653 isoform X3 n=1 Tax=Sander lucioperca TaxID=283035 RepID=UPI00125D106B|nr:protein let-653 isoform X3 [Sander lucioperca]